MKRILDSSKTLTHHLVRSNSKSRRPFSRDLVSNDKKPNKPPVANSRRHVSVSAFEGHNDGHGVDLDVSKHNMPEKLNWYWNLTEDHKRKITDPTYVRQAVQDTFMQRAQGGYHYKRTGTIRNSSSATSAQPGSNQKAEVPSKSSKAKAARPPPPSSVMKLVPKPQVPKRKRIIDTAKPIQHYLSPKAPADRRIKSGVHLKEAGRKQLEEAKKKLYDPAPAVLDYLIEKHVPKMSGLQIRGRREKAPVDQPKLPPVPSLVQRVFGWKGKEEQKKGDPDISITPRSIEVRKKALKLTDQKHPKMVDQVESDSGKNRKKRKPGNLLKSLKGSAKKEIGEAEKKPKKPAGEPEEKRAQQALAQEDRQAIWNKMKASTAPSMARQEIASVKKQVRDFELTPQIYPKGSLSMRKSYLPITACRPRSNVGKPTESHTTVYSLKEEAPIQPEKETTSITNHILDSLKNIFSKMRRNSA